MMQILTDRLARAAMLVAATMLFGHPASALVPVPRPATTGSVVFVADPPVSVVNEQWLSADEIRVFQEQAGYRLTTSLPVNIGEPGFYQDLPSFASPVPRGSIVDVYFLHYDPEFFSVVPFDPSMGIALSGSITFDDPIVGLLMTGDPFQASSYLGNPATEYPPVLHRFELSSAAPDPIRDELTLSADGLTLGVNLSATTNADQMRVIVLRQAVPEPGACCLITIAALAVAIPRFARCRAAR